MPAREEARVPPQVLRLARRRLAAGERLEMGALAAELGVNRVTLYRWVGSRERLLVEVLWSMADEALSTLRSEAPPTADRAAAGAVGVRAGRCGSPPPPARAGAVVIGFIECVLANPGMRHLLAADTDLVMRLLTHRAARFQPRPAHTGEGPPA